MTEPRGSVTEPETAADAGTQTRPAAGLLLAAGGGRRMGGAKALLREPSGRSWLERGLAVLGEGGCAPLVVVLGAEREAARPLAVAADLVVESPDWERGQAASVAAGLAAVEGLDVDAVCLLLVDLPDVGAPVVERVLGAAGTGSAALARATYRGRPGHPVVLGRAHWAGITAGATGDHGARDYLATHPHTEVECGDLATGRDVDSPGDLP